MNRDDEMPMDELLESKQHSLKDEVPEKDEVLERDETPEKE